MQELIDEVPIHVVASKFKVNRGILQGLQQCASLFAGVVTSFCSALDWDLLSLLVSQFKDRIFFGVHQDLLDLMKIPTLNSQRARALFKAGFHTLVELSNSDLLSIEKCLYDSISFDTKKRDGESKYDEEQRNELRLVFITGKAGLTVPEAAKMIKEGARNHLQKEFTDIIWTHDVQDKIADISQEQTGSSHKRRPEENIASANECNIEPISEKTIKICAGPNIEMKSREQDIIHDSFVSPVFTCSSQKKMNPDELGNNSRLPIKMSQEKLIDAGDELKTVDRTPITIVDVFESADFSRLFHEKFHVFSEGGFSLDIHTAPKEERKVYNCVLSDDAYLDGVSLCLGEKVVFYLNLQANGSKGMTFTEKIFFLREILMRSDFTLKMFEAKAGLKKIINCIPISNVNCLLEDPKIAQWLLQSNIEPDFNGMVSINAAVYSTYLI